MFGEKNDHALPSGGKEQKMRIGHVTINSGKLEESIKFYQNIAGLEIIRDMRGKGPLNIVFLADEKGAPSRFSLLLPPYHRISTSRLHQPSVTHMR